MADRLQVMNSALVEVGGRPLTTDPLIATGPGGGTQTGFSRLQSTVGLIYPQVRDASLAMHPWSWLMQRAALAPADPAEDREHPYRYRWRHPSPYFGVIRALYDRADADTPRVGDWAVEGQVVRTSFSPVWARYPREVSEPVWALLFTNAVILALAARLAIPVAFDMDLKSRLNTDAEAAFIDAKKADTQSQPNEVVQDFEMVAAHTGGYDGLSYRHGVVR